MRYALKFAYDGQVFDGYARQPEGNTVEGEILQAMKDLGVIKDVKASNFQSASRTDKGVSAAGNVVGVDSNFNKNKLIPALNSRLDGVAFYGIATVGDDFNPRHAKQRWYRYVLLRDRHTSKEKLEEAAQDFVGEHDFRALSKKDTGEENTVLTIDSIDIQESDDFLLIDIRARRFLWQMVRRLVSAMLAEYHPSGIEPMPAENLVLMDVVYDFGFEISDKTETFSTRETRAKIRVETMRQICDVISSA